MIVMMIMVDAVDSGGDDVMREEGRMTVMILLIMMILF